MSAPAVLVLSCDKYSGLWDLFFSRWERYWPDCRCPTYLLSNTKLYARDNVTTLCTGEDRDWSSNLIFALDRIQADDILLMMEDAPLNAMVDDQAFTRLFARYQREGMNYLNLKAEPRPRRPDHELGELPSGSLYRAALVPSLWNKSVLRQLLVVGETAWQFEIAGSQRSDRFPGFFSVRREFFGLLHCVIRGKLDLRAARVLERSGEIAALGFPSMTFSEYLDVRVRESRGLLMRTVVPVQWHRRLRSLYYRLFARATTSV
jgi:hypothetical protein